MTKKHLGLLLLFQACASYPTLMPADNMKAGQWEFGGGPSFRFSKNDNTGIVESLFAGDAHLAYAATDSIQFVAQTDGMMFYSGTFQLQLLSSNNSPLAAAVVLGMGMPDTPLIGGFTLGKKVKDSDLYLGARVFTDISNETIYSFRAGARFAVGNPWYLGIEGGCVLGSLNDEKRCLPALNLGLGVRI